MEWELRWGGEENRKLFRLVYEDTGEIPPQLLKKPVLSGDCIKYHDAYRYLGACRLWGQVGPLPIPLSEIEAYLNLDGVTDPLTRMKYVRLIGRMDQVELKHLHEKSKPK